MRASLYSVFDRAAKSFGSPLVFPTDDMCVRGCTDLFRGGGDAPMIVYPDDFDVYRIGDYDTDTGVVFPTDVTLVFRFASLKGN